MKKKFIPMILLSALMCSCGESNSSDNTGQSSGSSITDSPTAEEPVSDENFVLSDDQTSFTLVKCPVSYATSYQVPATYKGLPVTSIKKTAFAQMMMLNRLTIPSSVTYIEKGTLGPIASFLSELVTPFVGETAFASDSYIGLMFGVGDVVGKNLTSYYAPNFATLTITNQEILPNGLLGSCDTLTSVTIENCKEIGGGALKDMEKLTSLSLPDGLEKIGVGAFGGDVGLTSLNIPSSVTTIGGQAFVGLPFKTLELPKSLKEFDYYQDMDELEAWSISDENEYFCVDDGVLYSKDHKKLINFPKAKDASSFVLNAETEEIGTHAFEDTNIASIDLSNVSSIGSYSFYTAKALNEIHFGNQLTNIGSSAFYGNVLLDVVTFPSTLATGKTLSIDNLVFAACGKLTSITLPSYITSIPNSMFASCSSLSSVNVEGAITNLGIRAFAGTALKQISLTFGDNASIQGTPFADTKLETLELHFLTNVKTYPSIVSTGLGVSPSIIVDSAEIASALKTAWSNDASLAGLVQVAGTETGEFTIEDGVLLRYDASKSSNPKRIIIPDTVTSIANGAIICTSETQYIYIPSSVQSIATSTSSKFGGISGTKKVLEIEFGHDDPSILTTTSNLDKSLGVSDSSRTVLTIKNKEKEATFRNCFTSRFLKVEAASEVYLDSERNEIYDADKTVLLATGNDSSDYTFADSVIEVGANAFNGNSNLTNIDWNNVEKIDEQAFYNCSSIEELHFGEKIVSIGEFAFYYTLSLKTLSFSGATAIGDSAFYSDEDNGYSIESLDFGNKGVSIDNAAFSYAIAGNTEIFIPASCIDVNSCAFSYFTNQDGVSIYFENPVSVYLDIDESWVDDFTGEANSLTEAVIAFYSESAPSEQDLELSCQFWHYDESGNKIVY